MNGDMAKDRGSDARTLTLREQALGLRLAGAAYREIGKRLGISHAHAHRLVRGELEKLEALSGERAEELRRLELERLDQLQKALWAKRGEARESMQILRVMESRRRLLGLDAPAQVEVQHSEESADERSRRMMERAARRIAAMTPEEVAAEAAHLSEPD
jgi:hypothetical protein